MTNYLIVGPAWVGDMVMAQSLFQFLRQRDPHCQIDVLAPDSTLPLLSRMPEIRRAISAPFKHGELALKKRYQLACSLRADNYDKAILLTNTVKTALIPFWARIPIRVGGPRRVDKKKYPLMIQQFCALALSKGEILPEILPFPKLITPHPNPPPQGGREPILILCPGAEYGPAKRWPPAHYAAVANAKLADGWKVWILGSRGDAVAGEEIQHYTQNRCHNLIGKTTLLEAIDLIAQADAVVTNDSGLMHIAAAVQRQLVVLYGSTDSRFTPPLTNTAQSLSLPLACRPCFQRTCPLQHLKCLRELTPEYVLKALKTLI
ncbi:MAG: lipopolysaccharide heptosyltransferase II [Gammaproteobacteria bacterium]